MFVERLKAELRGHSFGIGMDFKNIVDRGWLDLRGYYSYDFYCTFNTVQTWQSLNPSVPPSHHLDSTVSTKVCMSNSMALDADSSPSEALNRFMSFFERYSEVFSRSS